MKKIIDIILEFKKSHSEKKWYGEKKLYNMLKMSRKSREK